MIRLVLLGLFFYASGGVGNVQLINVTHVGFQFYQQTLGYLYMYIREPAPRFIPLVLLLNSPTQPVLGALDVFIVELHYVRAL